MCLATLPGKLKWTRQSMKNKILKKRVRRKRSVIGVLLAIILSCGSRHVAAADNILFILMEDMGVQIPAYGDYTVATPNLDRLAEEGVVFERAHVVAATCAASRGALFSGLHPHQNGIMGFINTHGFHYRQGLRTFIHALKEKGYVCGLTYKTGVQPNPPFDFTPNYKQNRLSGEDSDHLVNNSVDNFRVFLQNLKKATPFYFQAQTPDTHSKWHRPEFIKPGSKGWPYPDVDLDKVHAFGWLGEDFPMSEKFRHEVGTYYRAIQRVDWYVGELLALLDEFGHTDNTLVIFSSDHGPSHLLRGKTTPYEAGLQVPFIVRWPGVVANPGTSSSALVSFVDLSPTFQEVAGVAPPPYLPGYSLIPVFKGEPPARKHLYSSYVAHTTNQGSYWPNRTISNGRHKLIHNLNGDSETRRVPNGYNNTSFLLAKTLSEMSADSVARAVADRTTTPPEFELYDLKNDPGEIHNLIGQTEHAEVERSLREQLRRWRIDIVNDPFCDPHYLESFNADYAQRLDQYEQKRQQMSAMQIKSSEWKVDWDHRIPAWNPTPYLRGAGGSK
jgi:N-sulfoglucosamine sulfohydrolase